MFFVFDFSLRAEKYNEATTFSVVYFTNHSVAYVVGGRVGMDDTHLTRSHWKLVLLLLLLHSYSLYIYTPPPPFWGYARPLSPSFAPVHQFFASCARSSVAGRTVFTTLLENRFSKRTVFTIANEIGFPGLTIFTIVLKRVFLYAQFLQYVLRRGVKKQ